MHTYEQRQHVATQQQHATIINSKLIASINILHLSSLELEQSIARELAENPAFEAEEVPQCLTCGSALRDGACATCGSALAAPRSQEVTADWSEPYEPSLAGGPDDDEADPITRVSTTVSLQDALLATLATLLPPAEMPIAEALVGNLDEHGWLKIALDEVADELGVSVAQVESVLAVVQAQEPLGIGGRSMEECLLIQLRWFRDQGHPQPLAEQVVARFLKDIGERRYVEIGRELGTTSTHIRRAHEFIKTNLNPFPAHEALGGPVLRGGTGRGATALVRPDVIIRRTETGFETEVVESRRFQFRVNAVYAAASQHGQAGISDADRRHIREHVEKARFFIDCVRQRWDTLKKISDALIAVQYDFLDRGVRFLRPLTRSELATYVEVHEATISRATNDKYVLLPDGRTIPFDDFFNASLRAKDTLRELIAAEDPRHPLSDEDLAEKLMERGMILARRTVAKYRESLRILPSRLR